MRKIREIYKWILKNKKWLFSGIGVSIISLFLSMIFNINNNKADTDDLPKETNRVEVNGSVEGNIYQDSSVYIFSEDKEKEEVVEKEKDEISSLSKIIDSENEKHWSEKHIIGVPYTPNLNVLKWINDAKDYTNDWEAYEPQLFYHDGDTGLENAKLVGKTENFLLYDIFIKSGSMLIKTPDGYYVLAEGICSTSTTGGSIQPSVMEADYDNDGDNELAIRVWLLHGTGKSIDSLFIVDKVSDGCWYMFQFLLKDHLNEIYKKYTSTVIDNKLYFVWNNNVIDIPQKLQNKEHSDYYCIGEIVDIEFSAEEILVKLDAGYNIDAYWDYFSGHGIMAKVQYQGKNNWELVDYDYYNDSLEKYIIKIMGLFLKQDREALRQEFDFTFPEFHLNANEYDIAKILYDSNQLGNDTFRVDVMYTVDNIGITFHAILTIKQIDSSDSSDIRHNGLWEICDFMIIE